MHLKTRHSTVHLVVLDGTARYECVSYADKVAYTYWYWKELLGTSVSYADTLAYNYTGIGRSS